MGFVRGETVVLSIYKEGGGGGELVVVILSPGGLVSGVRIADVASAIRSVRPVVVELVVLEAEVGITPGRSTVI